MERTSKGHPRPRSLAQGYHRCHRSSGNVFDVVGREMYIMYGVCGELWHRRDCGKMGGFPAGNNKNNKTDAPSPEWEFVRVTKEGGRKTPAANLEWLLLLFPPPYLLPFPPPRMTFAIFVCQEGEDNQHACHAVRESGRKGLLRKTM